MKTLKVVFLHVAASGPQTPYPVRCNDTNGDGIFGDDFSCPCNNGWHLVLMHKGSDRKNRPFESNEFAPPLVDLSGGTSDYICAENPCHHSECCKPKPSCDDYNGGGTVNPSSWMGLYDFQCPPGWTAKRSGKSFLGMGYKSYGGVASFGCVTNPCTASECCDFDGCDAIEGCDRSHRFQVCNVLCPNGKYPTQSTNQCKSNGTWTYSSVCTDDRPCSAITGCSATNTGSSCSLNASSCPIGYELQHDSAVCENGVWNPPEPCRRANTCSPIKGCETTSQFVHKQECHFNCPHPYKALNSSVTSTKCLNGSWNPPTVCIYDNSPTHCEAIVGCPLTVKDSVCVVDCGGFSPLHGDNYRNTCNSSAQWATNKVCSDKSAQTCSPVAGCNFTGTQGQTCNVNCVALSANYSQATCSNGSWYPSNGSWYLSPSSLCSDKSLQPCSSLRTNGQCRTIGGNVPCAPCVFPFTYNGQEYSTCDTKEYPGSTWCSIETDDGKHVPGRWGECPSNWKSVCRSGINRSEEYDFDGSG